MTYNTGNPIGSTDARDRSDNSENLDLAVNSLSQTFVDRLGVTRDTLEGVYQKSAYYRAGTFDAGYTLTNNRQTLAYGNVEYSWSGVFPKVVAAASTPETTGGIGAGAWIDRTQETFRSELAQIGSPVLVGGKSAGFIAKNQYRVSAIAYGVPLMSSGSAVDKLQEMINADLPIWLDAGDYLIDKTLLYKDGMDISGPGRLYILSDSSFTVIPGNFIRNEAAISASGSVTTDTYKIKLKCRMYFSHSDPTKPAYPIRFTGLINSTIDLDFEAVSSGDVTDTNMPDFYYNNHNVSVIGRYRLTHHNASNTGGMWIRDVNIGANANSLSTNVILKAGSVVQNNGIDEAVAFFNPSNGRLRNCGVEPGVRILGSGLGLSFLNFSGDAETTDNFSVFAGACEVEVSNLRINQGAVKYSYCNPKINGLVVRISGFSDNSASGFYAAFRCMNDRTDGMRANLANCKAYLLASAQPVGSIFGYSGAASVVDCETKHYGVARFNNCVKDNAFIVRGGFYPDAIGYAISNCTRVYNPRVLAASRYESVTYLSGLNISKRESITTDANGRATINHNIGAIPSFISVSVVDSGGSHAYAVEYDYPTTNNFQIRVYNKTTNSNAGAGTFIVNWKVEE